MTHRAVTSQFNPAGDGGVFLNGSRQENRIAAPRRDQTELAIRQRRHLRWPMQKKLVPSCDVVCLDQPEVAIMTYQNELDTKRRSDQIDDTNFTHWIIVGAVALAIVIAAAAITSTGNDPDVPQSITTVIAPAPSP